MVNKILCIAIITVCNIYSFSIENLEFKRNENRYYYEISPVVLIGTHVDGIGMNSQAGLRLNYEMSDKIVGFCIGMHFYPDFYVQYYGIPGNSFQINSGASLCLTFGKILCGCPLDMIQRKSGMRSRIIGIISITGPKCL